MMEQTGRVGGKAPRNIFAGARPKVKAYVGPLSIGIIGIEFYTNVSPDRGTPPHLAYWSQGRSGILNMPPDPRDGEDIVAILARIVKRADDASC